MSHFPLQWPDDWPRTPRGRRRHSTYKVNVDAAAKDLLQSIRLLGCRGAIVISSNVPPRTKELIPSGAGAGIDDPGVAVYWTSKNNESRVMACDCWLSVRENVRAIGLAVDALRAIDRSGATQILDRAFQAFGALPASASTPTTPMWWERLGLSESALSAYTLTMVEAQYRTLARAAHPDHHGGSTMEMQALNAAMEAARTYYRGK